MSNTDKEFVKIKKIKGFLTELALSYIEESKKLLTCRSITQYLYYDLYQAQRVEFEKKQEIYKKKKKIQDTISYLQKANYIAYDVNKNINLTKKGWQKALINKLKKIGFNKKNKKINNGLYLIIFDVPENLRQIRTLFRKALYNAGAKKIQKSAFLIKDKKAYDYLRLLAYKSEITEFIKMIEIKKIDV